MPDTTVRVEYIGAVQNFSEVTITGNQQVWRIGSSAFVETSRASQLVASGKFRSLANDPAMLPANQAKVGASPSDQVVGSLIPMVGGKYAPTQADLLRLFPLPTHRPIANAWNLNVAGATGSAGFVITIEDEPTEFGGKVVKIALPQNTTGGSITIPINPDLTGAYPKSGIESCLRIKCNSYEDIKRLYFTAGDAALTNAYLWILSDDSYTPARSMVGLCNGPYPEKWNNVYRTLRLDPFAQATKVGSPVWNETNPDFEMRAIRFTYTTNATPTYLYLSRYYSPEWSRGAIVVVSDGGYQINHDNLLPYFSSRGWPGVVSRVAYQDATYTADAQWPDWTAAGWDVVQHITIGNSALTSATTQAQVEQSLENFKALVASLKVNCPGNYLASQFVQNAGRYAGSDIAGILRSHGVQSSRGVASDAEFGIDPWNANFYATNWAIPRPHGFIPRLGRYNKWSMDPSDEATPLARDTYSGSKLERSVALAANGKNLVRPYIHRTMDYDGVNPGANNVGKNLVAGFVADLERRFTAGALIPLSETQLDGLTYNRPGDVFTRWDGEWVSRTTGKIVI